MSGIAGIYNLDGRPADRDLLTRMTDRMAHRGPDGVDHWIDGPVALGHRMLRTTPESLGEKQPLTDETGDLCLTLDGRVDNRDDLREALEAKGARLRTATDAELVLKAYESWGKDCPERILGDFAFAVWDRRNRWLFCARDFLGKKPFYYHLQSHKFLFGSELRLVLEDETVERKPNEGMVAEYLASRITSQEETLFSEILRLPPAHWLIVQPGALVKKRFWDIDPANTVRYRNDREYADHFLNLLRQAVRCCLRSQAPVGAYLSGGLDSSSVVCVAHSLLAERGSGSGPEAFSVMFPGRDCDETKYITAVARKWNIKVNGVNGEDVDASAYQVQSRRSLDFTHLPGQRMADSFRVQAREKNIRVLLTGVGGDEWLSAYARWHYADLLRAFRFGRLARDVWGGLRHVGFRASLYHAAGGAWLHLPWPVRQRIKALFNITGTRMNFPWIPARFRQRTSLLERICRQHLPPQGFSSLAKEVSYANTMTGLSTFFTELEEQWASLFGVEQRDPLSDRRIVEFVFAVPEDQRWRNGLQKFILRQALRGLLPEVVRRRPNKSHMGHMYCLPLRSAFAAGSFDRLAIGALGWIEVDQVRKMYTRVAAQFDRRDRRYSIDLGTLWMIFGIEWWYRAVALL
ncbi:hypothetical protein AYO44_06390 [Planctomycetaceae bacterium SCGC AG-212-F19]|nr:hypothetical protein AYO44_06390 [Planctomycetaceae bacterium SCGC AG-212-F19]